MSDFGPNDRGEYPIGPEPAPNPRPVPASYYRSAVRTSMIEDAPIRREPPPPPIPYARVAVPVSPPPLPRPPPSISPGWQFTIGLGSALFAGIGLFVLDHLLEPVVSFEVRNHIMQAVFFGGGGVFLLATILLYRRGWTGFVPGVVAAILASPLWMAGLCAMGIFKLDMR